MIKDLNVMISDDDGFIYVNKENTSYTQLMLDLYNINNLTFQACINREFKGFLVVECTFTYQFKQYKKEMYLYYDIENRKELLVNNTKNVGIFLELMCFYEC